MWEHGRGNCYENDLFNFIEHKISKKDNTLWRDLDSARSKLEVALRFFNGDDSKQTVTITFRIPVNTIYNFMPEDFTAITTALHEYIKERFYRLLISNM